MMILKIENLQAISLSFYTPFHKIGLDIGHWLIAMDFVS